MWVRWPGAGKVAWSYFPPPELCLQPGSMWAGVRDRAASVENVSSWMGLCQPPSSMLLVDARTDQEAPPPFGVDIPGRTRGSGRSPGALLLSRELLVTPSGQYSQCTLSRSPNSFPGSVPPEARTLLPWVSAYSHSHCPHLQCGLSGAPTHTFTLTPFQGSSLPRTVTKLCGAHGRGRGSLRTSRREVFFQCLPGPTPALQPHPIPRGTLISQTTLGGEAWRAEHNNTPGFSAHLLPLGLTDSNNKPGAEAQRPRSRTSTNPGGWHPD